MAKFEPSLRLYHKHRLDFIKTGDLRSFRLMQKHYSLDWHPVGKRRADQTIEYSVPGYPIFIVNRPYTSTIYE
jgi:hypothetical protein